MNINIINKKINNSELIQKLFRKEHFTMKKFATIIMLTLLVFSLTVTSYAADIGSFLESPSAKRAPTLVSGSSEDHSCEDPLIITAYGDRDELPEDLRKAIEDFYTKIMGVKNLVGICPDLKDIANDQGIPTSNLAVSDLFDIRDKCGEVEGKFDIVIKSATFENFVGLIHYTDGEFVLVEDAKVEEIDGEIHLSFTTDGLSPFAVVVNTGDIIQPEDNSVAIGVLTTIAVAEGAVLITILVKFILSKKLG